jgi:hypothetical protein
MDAAAGQVFLGAVVRHLGERFSHGDADRDRDTGPLQHALPQQACLRFKSGWFEVAETEESLVDRVELEIGCGLGKDTHHARAHVAIERVVARAHAQNILADALAHHMPRLAHYDAERFGLVRARDHAAVVVGEHDQRHATQLRLKHALATGVQVVAVHERDGSGHRATAYGWSG